MFGKTKWYKTAFKAYRKKKIKEPYRTLLHYYMQVGHGTPIAHIRGHHEYFRDYFSLQEYYGPIEATTENLRAILPKHLFDNYLSALEVYKSLGEDPEYEIIMTAFERQDEYIFDHCDEIIALLKDYVDEMTAKNIF